MHSIHKSKRGFTLVELLVVISIIALLLAILMPSLKKARDQAKRIVGATQQKNTFMGMMMYVHEYAAFFPAQNGEQWYSLTTIQSEDKLVELDENDKNAYWGLAYRNYGAKKELFKCPAKKYNAGYMYARTELQMEAINYSDYGLNGYVCWKVPAEAGEQIFEPGEGRRKFEDFKNVSKVIAFHDHIESTMDFNKKEFNDSYWRRPTEPENLWQWKYLATLYRQYKPLIPELWRHGHSSNIAWLDGHISNLKETTGENVPFSWYSGGLKKESDY